MKLPLQSLYFLLLTFLSCQETRQPISASDSPKSTIDSIRLMLNNYFADVKKEGLTAEFKYLDSSADFFWVPPGYASPIAYDSVAAILRRYQPFYKLVDNSWQSLLIRHVTTGLATYSGTILSNTTDTAGNTKSFILVETGLVIKRAAGWKLLNGQTSVVPKSKQ